MSFLPLVSSALTLERALHASAAVLHGLAGAAWFGSMFYSLTVLQPRAKKYFGDEERFEEFVATIGRGARWKVLTAFALVLVSGAALVPLARPSPAPGWWVALMVAKAVLFAATLVVFCYTSWRLWPARIFATPQEAPAFQRKFRLVRYTMIVLVAISLCLGIVAHVLR